MERGRPTKFNDRLQVRVKMLATKGFTDSEMSTVLDISESTLNRWKIKYPDFWESLKNWKDEADLEIEGSLYIERGTWRDAAFLEWSLRMFIRECGKIV